MCHNIALYLNRHVVALDLRSMTKREAFDYFHHPPVGPNLFGKASDVVFSFEEFHATVAYLYTRSQAFNGQMERFFVKESIDYAETKAGPSMKIQESTGSVSERVSLPMSLPDADMHLTLDDLLDFLDGPCSPCGLVCVATTNHLERIEKMCPPLIRPGRLTPMSFEYFDGSLLEDVCTVFFWYSSKNSQHLEIHVVCRPKNHDVQRRGHCAGTRFTL